MEPVTVLQVRFVKSPAAPVNHQVLPAETAHNPQLLDSAAPLLVHAAQLRLRLFPGRQRITEQLAVGIAEQVALLIAVTMRKPVHVHPNGRLFVQRPA